MLLVAYGLSWWRCGGGGGGGGAERLFATPSFVALARFMVTAPVDVEEISADWRGDGEGDAKDFLATLSLAALTTFLRRSRSRRIWSCIVMRAGVCCRLRRKDRGISEGVVSCREAPS